MKHLRLIAALALCLAALAPAAAGSLFFAVVRPYAQYDSFLPAASTVPSAELLRRLLQDAGPRQFWLGDDEQERRPRRPLRFPLRFLGIHHVGRPQQHSLHRKRNFPCSRLQLSHSRPMPHGKTTKLSSPLAAASSSGDRVPTTSRFRTPRLILTTCGHQYKAKASYGTWWANFVAISMDRAAANGGKLLLSLQRRVLEGPPSRRRFSLTAIGFENDFLRVGFGELNVRLRRNARLAGHRPLPHLSSSLSGRQFERPHDFERGDESGTGKSFRRVCHGRPHPRL